MPKLRSCSLVKAFCAFGVVFIVNPGQALATPFDAADDFSPSSNPNGAWSYGWSPVPGGAYSLYTTNGQPLGSGVDSWFRSSSQQQPSIFRNSTANPINVSTGLTIAPNQLVMHPGPANENNVLRWTPPTAGVFTIDVTLTLIDQQAETVDVHVFEGATSLLDETLSGVGDSASLVTSLVLGIGATLDFTVGFGTDNRFNNDSTSIELVITPEPSTAFLLSGGLLVLASKRRQRTSA